MDEEHDVVIFNALLVGLHLKLIMKHQPKHSLLNILINNLKPPTNRKVHTATRPNLLTLIMQFQMIIIPNVVEVLYLWIFNILLTNVLLEIHL